MPSASLHTFRWLLLQYPMIAPCAMLLRNVVQSAVREHLCLNEQPLETCKTSLVEVLAQGSWSSPHQLKQVKKFNWIKISLTSNSILFTHKPKRCFIASKPLVTADLQWRSKGKSRPEKSDIRKSGEWKRFNENCLTQTSKHLKSVKVVISTADGRSPTKS